MKFSTLFIGSTIFLVNVIGKVPAWFSLGVTIGLVTGGVVFSWLKPRKPTPRLSAVA